MGPLELDEKLRVWRVSRTNRRRTDSIETRSQKGINRLQIVGDLFLSNSFKKIILLSFWSLSMFRDLGY